MGGGGTPTIGDEVPDRVFDSEDVVDTGGKLLKKELDVSAASRWRERNSRCDIGEGGEGKYEFIII